MNAKKPINWKLFSVLFVASILVLRAIILNGITGVTFVWLFWKNGLEAAMISHFTTDTIYHVNRPSLI